MLPLFLVQALMLFEELTLHPPSHLSILAPNNRVELLYNNNITNADSKQKLIFRNTYLRHINEKNHIMKRSNTITIEYILYKKLWESLVSKACIHNKNSNLD